MLDETNYLKVLKLQAKRIRKTKRACSFSKMVSLVLKNGLKKKRLVTLKK